MSDVPRCGAPCWSNGYDGDPCQVRVGGEGVRCPLHQREDVPILEEAPEPGE